MAASRCCALSMVSIMNGSGIIILGTWSAAWLSFCGLPRSMWCHVSSQTRSKNVRDAVQIIQCALVLGRNPLCAWSLTLICNILSRKQDRQKVNRRRRKETTATTAINEQLFILVLEAKKPLLLFHVVHVIPEIGFPLNYILGRQAPT